MSKLADLKLNKVEKLLLRAVPTPDPFGSGWYWWGDQEGKSYFVPELGDVHVVEQFGGENLGDDYYLIFSVRSLDAIRYFKMCGWYASYDGGYYDGPFIEVTPVEKMVTVYDAVE